MKVVFAWLRRGRSYPATSTVASKSSEKDINLSSPMLLHLRYIGYDHESPSCLSMPLDLFKAKYQLGIAGLPWLTALQQSMAHRIHLQHTSMT